MFTKIITKGYRPPPFATERGGSERPSYLAKDTLLMSGTTRTETAEE